MLGPTASGKSEVGLRLARDIGAEIISVDSMQVYRGMDIGTAKPTEADRALVAHHLVDVVDPDVDYTVAEFQRQGRAVLDAAAGRSQPAVIVGGSGLHFRALVDPLEFPPSDPAVRATVDEMPPAVARAALLAADPDAAASVDLDNPRRVQRALEIIHLGGDTPSLRAASESAAAVRHYQSRYPLIAIGLDSGPELATRVRARFGRMLDDGLLDEVAALGRLGRNAGQAVGYKELAPVIAGEATIEEATEEAIEATMRLAKRQRTFFRRDPRIRWIEWDPDADTFYERVREVLGEDVAWIS